MRRRIWGSERSCAAALLCAGLIITEVAIAPPPARAFTIDPTNTNDTPQDPADDLLAAARWSNVPGSLALQGVRGLGGGIEYAIAADFCATLIPQFIDEPKPTCGQLRDAVRRAFDHWRNGHLVLRFVDASDRLRAELPPPDVRSPQRDFGAEIDLFALAPDAFPRVRGLGAVTGAWTVRTNPVGTNGRLLPGVTITSADIILNARSCYHLDPGLAGRRCNHFESLVLHEIGHALDLHHPNENVHRNFDTDSDPYNVIPIDCAVPTRGLLLSRHIDERAVMNRGLGEAMPVVFGLTNDDLGGRNFHYPNCPSGRAPGGTADGLVAGFILLTLAGRGRRPAAAPL